MRKITSVALAVATVLAFTACKNAGYKKTASGLMYKIVKEGSGPQAKVGDFIKGNFTQKINDSVVNSSSINLMPFFNPVDSVGAIYAPNEIFRSLHKGDSVEILMLADTILAKYPQAASEMKKGDKLFFSLKVDEIFTKREDVQADYQKEVQKKSDKQVAAVESQLKSKNISAQKTGKGTFVAIQNPGEGNVIDSGKYVTVRYTGKVFDTDKLFDSNTEAGKEPFGFTVGQQGVIPGWNEGVKLLKKGAKATFYIPGFLAYGSQGPGREHETLKFDVEVLDIADKAPAPKAAPQAPPMPAGQGSAPQPDHAH